MLLVRFLTQTLKVASVLLLAVLIVAGSVSFFNYWTDKERSENIGRPETITITDEDDPGSVADKLSDADLIQYGFYFENRFRVSGTDLRPGTYTLRHGMSVGDIINTITVPSEEDPEATITEPGDAITVTFIEGERIEQFAEKLSAAGWEGDPAEFIELAYNPVGVENWSVLDSLPDGASLEGFLFPDTYNFASNASAQDVINRLLDQFDQEFDESMQNAASEADMSVFEVVTLASIVEREAADEGERVTIAGLYLNRIEAGMPLQADPTVQYGLGTEDEWWPELNGELMEQGRDLPYSTYPDDRIGLPPGPIANPGLRAMQAVLQPEEHDYIYMVARKDESGTHVFAVTYEEHIANLCEISPESPDCSGGAIDPDTSLDRVLGVAADRRWLIAA
jgi:UPF0755 protein